MLRRLLIALASLALVAAALHGTTAAFTSESSATFTVKTAGVGITQDGDGLVFSSAPLAPGDDADTTVTVTNSGTLPADFALARTNLQSTSPNGCAVRDALHLRIVEDPAGVAKTLVDGPLTTAAATLALGHFAPGESRTYEITLTFVPQHGNSATDNDNCFEDSVDSERFSWQAAEATP